MERLKSTVWGGAWGLVVGGVIVAVASQLAVRHDLMLPQPEARAVETPAGTEFVQERPESDPAVPGEETVPAADVAAATPALPGPADASPSFDTTSAAAPATAYSGPQSPGRPEVPRGADVALTDREGLRPETAGAPEAQAPLPPRADQPAVAARDVPPPPVREAVPPVVEAAPAPETAPAAPPATETAALTAPAEDAAPVLAEAADEMAPAPAPEAPGAAADAPAEPEAVPGPGPVTASLVTEAPGAPETGADPAAPDPVAEATPAAPLPLAPSVEAPAEAPALARAGADAPPQPEAPEAADVAVAEADTAPEPQPESPALAGAGEPETDPAIPENPQLAEGEAAPSRGVGEPGGSIRIAQVPPASEPAMPGVPSAGIGDRVDSLPGAGSDGGATQQAAPMPRGDGALDANRRDFASEPGLARLAVVLVHESAAPPEAGALQGLPLEVSFAVDGGSANAAAIAAAYRAAGREVVLVPSIPEGARPQDVEVALEANLRAVSEAVAVMDTGSAGFQGDREVVGQVIRVIADTGHGLITAPQGLNTAQRTAERFDVPAALIFDDLGAGGDAAAVSRALDRAAFRARQEAGVILLGRADAATIEGLGSWLQGRNAESLAVAPVSAVIAPVGLDETASEEAGHASQSTLPPVRSLPGSQSN